MRSTNLSRELEVKMICRLSEIKEINTILIREKVLPTSLWERLDESIEEYKELVTKYKYVAL